MKTLVITVALLLLAGCIPRALNEATLQRVSRVSVGMSTEAVATLVGQPQRRQTHDNREVWQYCETGLTDYQDKYSMIFFMDGKVSRTDSYTQSAGKGPCSLFFRTVKWN